MDSILEKLEKTINATVNMITLSMCKLLLRTASENIKSSSSSSRSRYHGVFKFASCNQHISYGSEDAVDFADKSMEAVSYFAIQASSNLAAERGLFKLRGLTMDLFFQ